jgi:outer membrane receptor protein involved in Fe transport
VPGVPRQQLNLEGRIWLWDEFSIIGSYRLIGARYAISDTPNANGRIGTISVFRIGCQYRPQWSWLDGWMLGFTCDNLFDKNYCDYAVGSVYNQVNAYYPDAGRSFMFTVRYEF